MSLPQPDVESVDRAESSTSDLAQLESIRADVARRRRAATLVELAAYLLGGVA